MAVNRPQIDSLFHEVLKIEGGDERSRFLDQHCQGDSSLRQELEQLLRSHEEAASFLDQPPAFDIVDKPTEQPNGKRHPSVLKSIENTFGYCPNVELRDAVDGTEDPVQQLTSSEIPQREASERYQLFGEIARGGMGAIIKGRDIDLGRDLAVKVLLNEHKNRPDVVTRFVEEAQIGGQLQHPGIAPVYELGQFADERPFFTMKLVKGKTLAALLGERESTYSDRAKFLGIFEQICQTMGYAHSRCVIHRDLKPANIMVGAFGEVQVMDWGLAKVVSAGGIADEKKATETQHAKSIIATLRSAEGDTPVGFGSQTQMGSVMGTPAYMPPEQALGEIDQLDSRGDVFGLGAILCEILTGNPPYVADDHLEVFRLARRGNMDDCFERLDSCDADQDLIQLTKHCLAPDKSKRPADAGVLSNRVSRYLEAVESKLRDTEIERATQEARVQEERKRRRVSLALAASIFSLIVAVVGAGAWVQSQRATASRELAAIERANAAEAAVANEKLRHILYASELNLACSEIQNGNISAARKVLNGLKPDKDAPDLRGFEWNYLMRKCNARKKEKLFQWPDDAPKHWDYHRWSSTSANGNRLAAFQNHWQLSDDPRSIVVWNKRTGQQIWKKELPIANQGPPAGSSIALSSDGKLVAAVYGNFSDQNSKPSQLRVWEVDTGSLVHSIEGFDPVETDSRRVIFSPDSKSIFLASSRVLSNETISLLGVWDLGEVEPRFTFEGSFSTLGMCVSPDNSKVSLISERSLGTPTRHDQPQTIQILNAFNGDKLVNLTLEPFRVAFFARFSPDSRYLAVPTSNRSPQHFEFPRKDSLSIWDTKSGQRVASALTRSENCDLRYSPDGEVIALTSYGNRTIELFSAADGAPLARLTDYLGGAVEFSPDSKFISNLNREGVRSTWEIPRGKFDSRDFSSMGPHCISGDGSRFARLDLYNVFLSGNVQVTVYEQTGKVFSKKFQYPGDILVRMYNRADSATYSASRLALNHDGSMLVSVDHRKVDEESQWSLRVWDVDKGQVIGKLCDLNDRQVLHCLKAAPTGSHVAGVIVDHEEGKPVEKNLKIWDATTQKEVCSLQLPENYSPSDLEFANDGSSIAVVFGLRRPMDESAEPDLETTKKSMVRLYRVADGDHLLDLPTPAGRSNSVAFSRDGKMLAALNVLTSGVDIWNLETGSQEVELMGVKPRSSLAFTPDGSRLIAQGFEFQGQLNVWDLKSGNRMLNEVTYNFSGSGDSMISFLPDGHQIIRWGSGGPPLILDARPVDENE